MTQLQLILTPAQSVSDEDIRKAAAKQMQLPYAMLGKVRIIKRSVDARQKQIKVLLTVQAFLGNEDPTPRYQAPQFLDVHSAMRQVVIVGAGPAGLFAALTLLENGIRPIVIDRGKDVSQRKRDIALLNRNEGLNPESNYCFGEGGAGTFSDGKLFSRSSKRGDMQRVMELFHYFGADESVLYETHAHIGSDRLPAIIQRMRNTIVEAGGEVRFETRMNRLLTENGRATGVETCNGKKILADAVILAIGHSAHDTYRMLAASGVSLEPKGFAMGVRVEHPQSLIDTLMYHLRPESSQLPSLNPQLPTLLGHASYSLVTQVDGRGVYSFCMCPGGHIVPAGSEAESCVVNGMSASHRNSPYANSGIVVELRPEDVTPHPLSPFTFHLSPFTFHLSTSHALSCLDFQEALEHLAFEHGKAPNMAPAQRLRDFVEGRTSRNLPLCSYLPGIVPSRLDQWLPPEIGRRLQQGFRDFDRKYRGFLTNDAVVVGVESRSSSPVRIPRDRQTMQHIGISALYPCGEGAGYAGGITSSALDGINAAMAVSENIKGDIHTP